MGCSLKTKDGLLDIWTSTPDYIKLLVPLGRSADGFKDLVSALQRAERERASVSMCGMLHGGERNQSKANICLRKYVLYCSRIYKP